MPYIYFTDEQKLRANSVDLERYLLQNGEELIRSGPEKRLKSDKSITIRGSEWLTTPRRSKQAVVRWPLSCTTMV